MKRTAVILALAAAVCCQAQNLVKNGDFKEVDKNGKLTGWYYKTENFTRVDSDQPGKTGEKAMVTKVTLPEGKQTLFSSLNQKITLGPGKYRLTFTAKVIGDGYANCSWGCYTADRKRIELKKYWTPTCSGPEWKTITHELVIPEGTSFISLAVSGYLTAARKNKEGSMYFSGIVLTPAEGTAEKK